MRELDTKTVATVAGGGQPELVRWPIPGEPGWPMWPAPSYPGIVPVGPPVGFPGIDP